MKLEKLKQFIDNKRGKLIKGNKEHLDNMYQNFFNIENN